MRGFSQMLAGWRLCRRTQHAFRPFFPESVNSMTAGWNFHCTINSLGLAKPRTILDVGANASQMTKLILLSSEADADVYSFEPNPNLKPIGKTYPMALWDQEGEADFAVPSGDDLWGRLSPVAAESPRVTRGTRVRTARFDAFCATQPELSLSGMKRPRLVKVDTEGCEFRVLQGFGETLWEMDYLLVEVENREERGGSYDFLDVAVLVSRYGFNRSKILYACYEGPQSPAYCDVLFWKQPLQHSPASGAQAIR
jgi:FkbM family methyltransferase